MDSFRKDRLPDDQLSDVIAYIRALPQLDGATMSAQKTQPSKGQTGSTKSGAVAPAKCPKSAVPAARSSTNKKSLGKSTTPDSAAARGTSRKASSH